MPISSKCDKNSPKMEICMIHLNENEPKREIDLNDDCDIIKQDIDEYGNDL